MNIFFLYKFNIEVSGSLASVCAPYELMRQDGELVWRYKGIVLTDECGYALPLIYKDCPVLDELPPQNHTDFFFASSDVKVFNYIKYDDLTLETLLGATQ